MGLHCPGASLSALPSAGCAQSLIKSTVPTPVVYCSGTSPVFRADVMAISPAGQQQPQQQILAHTVPSALVAHAGHHAGPTDMAHKRQLAVPVSTGAVTPGIPTASTRPRPGAASESPEYGVSAEESGDGSGQVACFPVGREIHAVALSPDGKRCAIGLQDGTVQIWDLALSVAILVLKGHKNRVNDVSYSVDNVHVATASADKLVKIWNVANGRCEVTFFGHLLYVAAVSFADDALRVASGSWDKSVCVWDVNQNESPLLTLHGHTDWVHSVAWAPGGCHLASASSDQSVRLWNTFTGSIEQVLQGHLQTVSCISFSLNGMYLVSGSYDRSLRVWNVQEGGILMVRLRQESHDSSVHCVTFTPDGERVLAGCSDKSVRMWNLRTGAEEGVLCRHEDAVSGVAVTPDGRRVVSCSHDKTARVWQLPGKSSSAMPSSKPTIASTHTSGGGQNTSTTVVKSFTDLHNRLRDTEYTNQRLLRQLNEAQSEIEEKSRWVRHRDESAAEQEQQLNNYRQMVTSLTAEKERMEKSLDDMRRQQNAPASPIIIPSVPPSHAVGPVGARVTSPTPHMLTPAAAHASDSSASLWRAGLQLGPAGARRDSVAAVPRSSGVGARSMSPVAATRRVLQISHPAGSIPQLPGAYRR